ncbi:MAG: serine O-acetyltransferase [Nitrospirae bacterium]|nr:serine O-acetyltransferase [Candidatus Manganitrophaceae bacterium]
MFRAMRDDIRAIFERDPAARSVIEIVLTYSGFHATLLHRVSHFLWRKNVPVIPRLVSHFSRFITGIEIHPGAVIGEAFFIDHGMGVVIGETAEIGKNVTLYQGVTLGGTGQEPGKRHPTLGDNVIVGAGAKVLGAIVIGNHVRIGANSVVLQSVPDHATVVGIPGKIIHRSKKEGTLDHTNLPDPIAERIERLERELQELKRDLQHRVSHTLGGFSG